MELSALNQQIQSALSPTPAQPTTAQRAKAIADEVQNISMQSILQFVQSLNAARDLIWSSGVDPQKIVDALEAKTPGLAADVFAGHAAAAEFLTKQAPALVNVLKGRPDGYSITVNDDKSLTITESAE